MDHSAINGGVLALCIVLILPQSDGTICFEGTQRSFNVSELDGQFCINITRVADEGDPLSVGYQTLATMGEGIAAPNFDYIPVPAGGSGFERLRFEDDSESEEVCITILNDTRGCEGPETFGIILDVNPADSNPCGDEVIITITDTPVNILFDTRIVTQENAERVSFAMSRQAGITHLQDIIIRLAENSSDPKCVAERRRPYTFQYRCNDPECSDAEIGGSDTRFDQLELLPDNMIFDGLRECTLVATQVTDCLISFPQGNVVTIVVEDDEVVQVQFNPTTYSVNEDDGVAEVTLVTSSTSFSTSFTVTLSYQDITTEGSSDYTAVTTVTFGAGESSSSLRVPIVNDNIAELKETFNITIGGDDTAMVDIFDNDDLTVFFEPASYSVTEGETATLILATNIGYDFDFKVNVSTMDGTAMAEGDYKSSAPGYQATFTGSTAMPGSSTVEVPTYDDNIFEETERFFANIVVLPDYVKQVLEGNPSMAAVDILDNTPVLVYFDPDEYEVDEGEPAKLILRTDVVLKKRFGVIVIPLNDSAISPGDYEGVEKLAIFEVDSSMSMVTFNTFMNDPVERIESFNAVISVTPEMMAMGVAPGVPDTAVIIINDIENITVAFQSSLYTVNEGDGSLNVTIEASGALKDSYPLVFSATMGTAEEGRDWDGLVFMVTMPANEREATFSINIVDDSILELRESFSIELNEPTTANVQRGDPYEAIITIVDDDPITVSWEETMYTVDEADSTVEVALTASGEADFDYTVTVESMDVEAVDVQDYSFHTASGVFRKGSVREILNIIIVEDNIDELPETFTLTETINNVPDVMAGDPTITTAFPDVTTVLIIDNEDIIARFDPENYTEIEGSLVNLTVVLDKPPAKDVTVIITTMEITATPDDDYESKTCVVIIPANMLSGVCIVDLLTDSTIEDPEHFKATLTIPGGQLDVIPGAPDVAFVTIVDPVQTTNIQVKFGPVSQCLSWREDDRSVKLSVLNQTLSEVLSSGCECSFTISNSLFECEENQERSVVFIAEVMYSSRLNAPGPVTAIDSWKNTSPRIVFTGVRLTVDSSCPPDLPSLDAPVCEVIVIPPPESPPSDSVAIALGVVPSLLGVAIIVFIVIIALSCCYKKRIARYRLAKEGNTKAEYEDMSGVAMYGLQYSSMHMQANPAYAIPNINGPSAAGCHGDPDHTYETLPCELEEEQEEEKEPQTSL